MAKILVQINESSTDAVSQGNISERMISYSREGESLWYKTTLGDFRKILSDIALNDDDGSVLGLDSNESIFSGVTNVKQALEVLAQSISGGTVQWGSIIGNIANQTDLTLDNVAINGDTTTQTITAGALISTNNIQSDGEIRSVNGNIVAQNGFVSTRNLLEILGATPRIEFTDFNTRIEKDSTGLDIVAQNKLSLESGGDFDIVPGTGAGTQGQVLTKDATNNRAIWADASSSTILLESTGDTTDRTTEIQNSVNNASYVYLGPGDFYINGTVKMPSNTALLGIPGATKIIRGSTQDNLLRNNNTASGLYSGNENIFVQGIIFDAGAGATSCTAVAFGHCSNITVADCGFTRIYDWHGIEYNAVTNSTILNCKFYDFQGVDEDEEMIQLDNMGSTGRWPWDTGTTVYDSTPCRNISISNCSFQNGRTGIGSHSFEAGFLHESISIKGCTFDSLTSYGIRDVTGKLYTISNCTFDNIDVVGIAHLENATNDWTVTGCTFSNMTSRAIQMAYVAGLSISSNVINSTVSHAIGFDYCDNSTITNNSITDCEDVAIYCFRSLHSTISSNVVKGGGSNQGSTEADITIGSSVSVGSNTQDTIVTGNYCSDINTRQYSTRTVVENNIITTSTTNTTSTEYRELNNFIGGVWEVGSLPDHNDLNAVQSATNAPAGERYHLGQEQAERVQNLTFEYIGVWNSAVTYGFGQVVLLNNRRYISRVRNNFNNNPASSPLDWADIGLDTQIERTVQSQVNPATLTPDASTTKQINANAQTQALTINPPINPSDGLKVIYRIRASATSALTWSASFVDLRGTLPTSAPINKTIYVGVIYHGYTGSWEVVSVVEQV